MPYGRPQFGGQPLLQRAIGAAWTSANGGGPFSDGFASDFQPFTPDDIFTFQFIVQPTRVDVSGTAALVICLEDVNGVSSQRLISGGPPLPVGSGTDFIHYFTGTLSCLPATNTVRISARLSIVVGPPSSDPPSDQGIGNTGGQYVLSGAVWRLRVTGATGELDGQTDGFVSEGRL